jgi:hypothetical protein
MKSKITGAAATFAFFGLVSAASADMVTVTYSGTVAGGYDQLGIFGTPNTSLTGDRYTAVYFFNTAIGLNTSSVNAFNVFGGPGTAALGQPSPALGALITISSRNEGDDEDHFTSHSVFIDGSYFGQIESGSCGSLCDYLYTQANANSDTTAFTYVTKSALPTTITGNYTYEFQPSDTVAGSLQIGSFSLLHANLSPTTVTMSDPSALAPVPISNVGAGLPGILLVIGGLLWWRGRRCQKAAVAN